jgi:limonene-1,2-epoxide hydrolase
MSLPEAENTIRAFFAGWASDNPRQVFEDYLADECVWFNTGLPTMEGKAACMALVGPFLTAFPKTVIDIRQISSNDEVVFVQRTDRLFDPDGAEQVVIEVTGVLGLSADGKIVYWYDYFDPSPFAAMLAG